MSPPVSPPDSPIPSDGREQTSINNDDNAMKRRDLLNFLDSLRSMGLMYVLSLPQIVLVGSQSAGKSSVIESLCQASGLGLFRPAPRRESERLPVNYQIKLPRGAGTCTRCPIECQSRYADHPWRAQVSIRIHTGEVNDIPQVKTDSFGDPIDDPNLIEARIKQAQIAALNPDAPREAILNGGGAPSGGPSFSKNCVVVNVSGNELSDFSFVDLPGLIASAASDGNQADVPLVEGLVTEYMKKDTTINLILVNGEVDYETQKAGSLVRQYDPAGERTIGVVTKADRVEPGLMFRWIPMLTGETNPLKHRWYCVKQLSLEERDARLTWEDARNREAEFFETAPGWSSIAGEHRAKLGTPNLALKLGQVLSDEIHKSLPSIRREIENLIDANEAKRSRLPEHVPDGARALVLSLVGRFVRDVEKQLVRGDPLALRDGVSQRIRTTFEELRDKLQDAQPVFLPRERNDPQESLDAELPRPPFLPIGENWLTKSNIGNEFTRQFVAEAAKWGRTIEFPGHFPFEIVLSFMEQIVSKWKRPVDDAFAKTHNIFESKMLALIDDRFGPYGYGGLLDEVKKHTLTLLNECRQTTFKAIDAAMQVELNPASSHDDVYLAYEGYYCDYYRSFFDSASLERLGDAVKAGTDQALLAAIQTLEQFGLPKIAADEWKRIHPTKKVDRSVLWIMASVRAHYHIQFKRFADDIKGIVSEHYTRAFGERVESMLHEKLGLSSDETPGEKYIELTRESDNMAALRDVLRERAERLAEAKIKLA